MLAVKPAAPSLAQRLTAELLGTGLLVTVVAGSGIAAESLSPDDVGLQLLENSLATALGLAVLISAFGPVSGAHFNPLVSAGDWLLGRGRGTGLAGREVVAYGLAQVVGGMLGAVLANVLFDLPAAQISGADRASLGHATGEVVATTGLVLLIFALARTGRAVLSAASVGAYIGSAYWFTSSTAFANPAVTIGRMFPDTFAGIGPASVPLFVAAQVVGAGFGLALVQFLFPDAPAAAGRAVIPHSTAVTTEKS